MAGRRWTHDEDNTLFACARAGDPSYEIADRLGRSRGAVLKRAEHYGLRLAGGHWRINPDRRADLLNYLADNPGATLSDAARELRRCVRCVRAMAVNLLRDGLLERTGGATLSCRYVVTPLWTIGRAKPSYKTRKSHAPKN